MVARGARRVIVTAEEIVDEVSSRDNSGTYIPTLNVTAVVHTPGGAHPTSTDTYKMDREHVLEYQRACIGDERVQAVSR